MLRLWIFATSVWVALWVSMYGMDVVFDHFENLMVLPVIVLCAGFGVSWVAKGFR